jgi:hypothetical protein
MGTLLDDYNLKHYYPFDGKAPLTLEGKILFFPLLAFQFQEQSDTKPKPKELNPRTLAIRVIPMHVDFSTKQKRKY